MKELIKYLVAGFINTAIGYGVFLLLYRVLDYSPEIANTISYMGALCMAFILNRFFVFLHSPTPTTTSAIRFVVAFASAFLLNQAVLFLCIRILLSQPEMGQIFSMISYSVVFYLLNKYYVFSEKK